LLTNLPQLLTWLTLLFVGYLMLSERPGRGGGGGGGGDGSNDVRRHGAGPKEHSHAKGQKLPRALSRVEGGGAGTNGVASEPGVVSIPISGGDGGGGGGGGGGDSGAMALEVEGGANTPGGGVDPAVDLPADVDVALNSLTGDKLVEENNTKPCHFPWAARPHAESFPF